MKFNIKPKFAAKHAAHIVQQNSPTVLSAVAVIGVAGTVYLAAKAGFQSAQKIEDERYARSVARSATEPEVVISPQDRAALIWKLYMPAVGVAAATTFCIVASNRIAVRRLAAMAAAYGVLSGDFDEYRNKAVEMLGDKKAKAIDDKVAEEKIQQIALPSDNLLNEGESWFVDLSTMRPFKSTRESVEKGINQLNYALMHGGDHYADLNEAYGLVGLESTGVGNLLGWTSEQQVEVAFTPVFMTNGRPATGFKFLPEPKPDFDDVH